MANLNTYYLLSQQIAEYIAGGEKTMPYELEEWLNADARNKQLFNEMLRKEKLGDSLESYHNINTNEAWMNVSKQLFREKKPVFRVLWQRVGAIASLILIFAAGLYISTQRKSPISESQTSKNDIAPGRNSALLTLSNGQKIILSNVRNGELAKDGTVSVQKTNDGQVIYRSNGNHNAMIPEKLNTIATSRGQQFQVILPDGTKVWLNAASSLQFPSTFSGLTKRKVTLSGEAYFEVSKDKIHPFIVKSANQQVEVLGTHFNISAYPDEETVKTTLLEGAVKVNEHLLKPNQQSVFTNGQISIHQVNAADAVDWNNGEFICRNEPLESIMKKISRWYDVEVVYRRPELKNKTFSGSLSRYDHISGILNALELAGSIKFKLEGKMILVQ